ncbi:hypothetical protein PR1_78 [Providencia phage vB_PreS_PR1]|uniref:Uncharacterized protein n=1 Tax=Providencia phage vB_PreS_PR1 TaxID=1931407 RepID=A0A1S6KVA0_9CAUD|nr:hypothetical protein FDH30_gp137 [Providencia phage vB_PreS_PR1]AQT25344.1 hypothetical protein PR1_78 [Providencia phage vB_PreS_PR1]
MTKRVYKVYATEVIEVTSEVSLTDEEFESLKSMTSQESQDFIFEKVDMQCDDWERGDRLEIAHIELGSEIISD